MTNALWQRWMVLTNLACIVGWVAWNWTSSPMLAWAGPAVAALLFHAGLVGQFMAMAHVNRNDPLPKPTLLQMLRAWWAEACWTTVLFAWWQPFRRQAIPDWLPDLRDTPAMAPRGVVLVHGYLCNRGFWTPWLPLLRARGHAFVAVDLDPPFTSIDDYATTIDAAVRRVTDCTGRPPVVIGHSMGGMAIRAWLRAGGADARVHRVVTLGSPHGGVWAAKLSRSENGRQMALDSGWIRTLQQDEPVLRATRFTCWYSNCDNIVFPARCAMLAGADNRLAPGVAHVQLAFHPPVVQACLDEILCG